MKTRCMEQGCGVVIETGDSTLGEKLMAKHVLEQHGSIEAKHTKTLSKCLAIFQLLQAGQKIAKPVLREAMNEVSDLLRVPRAPEGVQENVPQSSVSSGAGSTSGVGSGADTVRSDSPNTAQSVSAGHADGSTV